MNSSFADHFNSAAAAAGTLECISKPAILYVEDKLALRELVAGLLVKSGCRVDVAEDGQAGWDALRLRSYDLLITDNKMPRLTGLELVERLRSAGRTLPVVMVSGSLSAEEAQQGQCVKLAATLSKPFTPEQLLRTVETVLQAAGAIRKRGDRLSPVAGERATRTQPVRGWGINE